MNTQTDVIAELYKRIPKKVLLCFSSGMIFGLLTHFYMLTHKLPNWDDLTNMNRYGTGAEFGRWFLEPIYHLFGKWSIPEVNGVLTILFLSIAACFLLLTLELQTMTSAVLLPLMLMTFPSIACMMSFMFTVHLYAFAIMMCCIGTYLYRKYRFGFIPAVVLFVLSCGMYQSYICFVAGILVFCLLLDLLNGMTFKKVFLNGIKTAITLFVSLLGYMIVSKLAVPTLANYRSINTMGQVDLQRLPRLIMRSYKRILEYFVIEPYSFTSPMMQILNIILCILIGVMIFWIAKETNLFKEIKKGILLFLLSMMIPLALASIYILAPETQDATMLMLFQYCFIYIMVVVLIEKCLIGVSPDKIKQRVNYVLGVSAMVATLLMAYNEYRVTNEAYFRTEIAFDRAYAYYNRIMMKVEEEPGYQYGDELALLGNFYPDLPPVVGYWMDDYKFEDMSGIAMENGLMTEGVRSSFLRIYLGIEIPDIEQERIKAVKESREYKEMPYYPEEGSLRRIDNIWVVRLHEDH
ncbi:MAG: glucosyltransferase domain-containing protein [Lachnospiraceae bacterium]